MSQAKGNDETAEGMSRKSHGALKNHKVFKAFFEKLDKQTLKALNAKEWLCPACKGGPKASASYKGMQSLMEHAKSTKNWSAQLHRKFVKVLEEEMERRVAASRAAAIVYGKWLGLEEVGDHEIVWPPMVIIRNTKSDTIQNQKVTGMGNKELLESFKEYKPIKAKYACGPKGHCGISLLIFEDTILGYLEGERLHKSFLKERRGRDAWNGGDTPTLHSNGKHILYGYMASKQDIENFDQCSTKDPQKLKYDAVSYKSKVLEPIKKMKEENERISWLESKIGEDQQKTNTLQENLNKLFSRLQIQEEEINILSKKLIEQDEECKNGIDALEHFYKQEIDRLKEDAERKDMQIEKIQDNINIILEYN